MMTHGQAKEIVAQLTRIANALEKDNSQKDFSAEDSVVLGMTKKTEEATKTVEEALGKIPKQ